MTLRDRIVDFRRVPASELRPNPKNWRTHPEAQRRALQAVLDSVGIADALIAYDTPDGLTLIDGHLRQDMTGDQEMPVLVLDVTEAEADMMLATLDPLAAMAEADKDALLALLSSIETEDSDLMGLFEALANDERFPMPDLGASERQPAVDPGAQVDRAEELLEKWQVERGQVWTVGRHRVMCGDMLVKADVKRLDLKTTDLVLTDPPYGVGIEYGAFDDTEENVRRLIQEMMPAVLEHRRALITPGHRCLWDYPRPAWLLGWVHPAGGGRSPWGFTCLNPILAYGKDPYLAAGKGSRADTLVLAADRKGLEGHPVPKPLPVWSWLLERGTVEKGETVYDPFLGSGTTMVAAEQLGRVCYGMEIEPKYVAVTLERMAGMGLTPERSL